MNTFQKCLCIIILLKINISQSEVISKVILEEVPSTNKVLVEILQLCQNDYSTIFVSSDSSDFNQNWFRKVMSKYGIILHKNKSNSSYVIRSTKWIDAAVLIAQSTENLMNMVQNLSTMVQWDLIAPTIFILNEKINNCEMAEILLKKAWHHEFLNSYFLCLKERKHDLHIYTYNPFTSRAPTLWKSVNQKHNNHNRWTMLYRKYVKENICQDFYFDRMKFLDGYEITISCWPKTKQSSTIGNFYNHSAYEQNIDLCHEIRKTTDAFVTGLNVTLKVYIQSHNWVQSVDYSESLKILKSEIYKNSSADLIFIREKLTLNDSPPNLTKTDIVDWSELGIVTYNRGYKTFMEKILNFYGFLTLSLTFLILLTTFFVIWITEKKGISFSIFEIIRLIISHTLHSRMETLSLRLFFSMILIYFLILQATFNGHLGKFLTKPERRSQAESLTDLHDLGYTSIYNTTSITNLLPSPKKSEASVTMFVKTCLMYIMNNDTSAACISRYQTLHRIVQRLNRLYSKKNFYISKKPFGARYSHFTIRQKWSLKQKVNKFFAQLKESGIRVLWFQNMIYNYTFKEKQAEAILKQEFQPIKFENLTFIFIILGIGLSCATVSFIIERWLIPNNDKCNYKK